MGTWRIDLEGGPALWDNLRVAASLAAAEDDGPKGDVLHRLAMASAWYDDTEPNQVATKAGET